MTPKKIKIAILELELFKLKIKLKAIKHKECALKINVTEEIIQGFEEEIRRLKGTE